MPTLINARALVHAGLLVTAALDQAPGSFQRASGEPGRKAKEEAAAAAAEAQAAAPADPKAKGGTSRTGSADSGSAKDSAAKGAVKTAKRRTKKSAAELDIDSAFGEDAGGF